MNNVTSVKICEICENLKPVDEKLKMARLCLAAAIHSVKRGTFTTSVKCEIYQINVSVLLIYLKWKYYVI